MPLAFEFCNANPNWMPRKPKLILKICPVDRRGFVFKPVLAGEEMVVLEAIS
jgi:hypothetical protein